METIKLNNVEISINVNIPTNPSNIAECLNKFADHLESNLPIPDHWEESKRAEAYNTIANKLTQKAKHMLTKLF